VPGLEARQYEAGAAAGPEQPLRTMQQGQQQQQANVQTFTWATAGKAGALAYAHISCRHSNWLLATGLVSHILAPAMHVLKRTCCLYTYALPHQPSVLSFPATLFFPASALTGP
jgi:hypothetical protein